MGKSWEGSGNVWEESIICRVYYAGPDRPAGHRPFWRGVEFFEILNLNVHRPKSTPCTAYGRTKRDPHPVCTGKVTKALVKRAYRLPTRAGTAFVHEDSERLGLGVESLMTSYAPQNSSLLVESLRDKGGKARKCHESHSACWTYIHAGKALG